MSKHGKEEEFKATGVSKSMTFDASDVPARLDSVLQKQNDQVEPYIHHGQPCKLQVAIPSTTNTASTAVAHAYRTATETFREHDDGNGDATSRSYDGRSYDYAQITSSAAFTFFLVADVKDEERRSAATTIQTAFRRFLARRELRKLKALVRLQALARGRLVRKQAASTLHCVQALVRLQARVRAGLVRMSDEGQAVQRQLQQRTQRHSTAATSNDGKWDNSLATPQQLEAKAQYRQAAAMRRRRALAYALSEQLPRCSTKNSSLVIDCKGDSEHWGWKWLDRWMAARPWETSFPALTREHVSVINVNEENLPNHADQSYIVGRKRSFSVTEGVDTQLVSPAPACNADKSAAVTTKDSSRKLKPVRDTAPCKLRAPTTVTTSTSATTLAPPPEDTESPKANEGHGVAQNTQSGIAKRNSISTEACEETAACMESLTRDRSTKTSGLSSLPTRGYMQATQSAKAKVRHHHLVSSLTIKIQRPAASSPSQKRRHSFPSHEVMDSISQRFNSNKL